MKPPKFHVGQAVVCVNTFNPSYLAPNEQAPSKGRVYHVRDNERHGRLWGIRLKEIINPPQGYYGAKDECIYTEENFAPVELLPDEELAELLAETLEPVTA